MPLVVQLLFAQQGTRVQDSLQGSVETKQLEEVVVIDTRFPTKRSQSGKPVIKINSETLQNFQGLGLSAVLKQ